MDINYYKKYEPIDGKWYINKELGNGAFGTVFEIERRDFTNDKSALKIITIPSSPNEVRSYREENYDLDEKSISSYFYGFVEEFTKEFALMTKLKGQNNVVRIEDYDVKEHKDEVGWDIFIRMELLTPMNKHFAQNPPTAKDVIKLGIDICKALEVCQKFNIVHRDIKPSNIFVSATGEFKLGDFGVARTLEKTSSGLSKKGTYTYMAPEVYRGEAYGSNVDIYSLGIVMYKLLNNNLEPFRTERTHTDEESALVARLNGEPMPKPANAEGRLAEIILKACSFNPKERYESPLQMRSELESILLNEDEEKLIHPDGEDNGFEPSDIPENDDSKTTGMSDTVSDDADDGKTVSLFGQVEEEKDRTVSIFDSRNSASNMQTTTKNTTSTTPASSKKEKTPSGLGFGRIDEIDEEAQKLRKKESSAKSKPTMQLLVLIVAVVMLSIFIIIGTTKDYVPSTYENTYDILAVTAKIEFVTESGNVLLSNSDIDSFSEGRESHSFYLSFSLAQTGLKKLDAFSKENPGGIVNLNINDATIAELTVHGSTDNFQIFGPNVDIYLNGYGNNGGFSESEIERIMLLLQSEPAIEYIPETEKTTLLCSVCGSTEHTTHPTCSVCGSTDHTSHPTCPTCGSTSHTSHPTCSVCGSTEHTQHIDYDYYNNGNVNIKTEYDSQGNIIAVTYYEENGTFIRKEVLEYNSAGKRIRTNYYNATESLESYETYEYDSWGYEVRRNSYNADGTLLFYRIIEFDENHKWIRDTTYNGDGTPIY